MHNPILLDLTVNKSLIKTRPDALRYCVLDHCSHHLNATPILLWGHDLVVGVVGYVGVRWE